MKEEVTRDPTCCKISSNSINQSAPLGKVNTHAREDLRPRTIFLKTGNFLNFQLIVCQFIFVGYVLVGGNLLKCQLFRNILDSILKSHCCLKMRCNF